MSKEIFIIGWGTGNPAQFTVQGITALQTVSTVFVKSKASEILTQISMPVKYVCPAITLSNGLVDPYRTLAADLISAAPAALLVPGDPLIDEASTPAIQVAAAEAGITVTVISAPNLLTHTLQTLQVSAGSGLQILDASLLCSRHYPPLEPDRPVLITGIYHPALISPLKARLLSIYHPQAALIGLINGEPVEGTIAGLDDSMAQIYLPPQPESIGLTAFSETIAHLRAPHGCPWDRKQTHQSLRPYLLEETHEVLTAIDRNNPAELAEELGDLLLQILLHAQIGAEAGAFRMVDIIHAINGKMLRRHPHVFGDVSVSDADEVVTNWAAIKTREKANNGKTNAAPPSVLDGVPPTLPALAQALTISKKAVDVGFEWQSIEGVLDKLVEEAREIVTAANPAEVESEIGDFLFVVVNLARKMKVDPESALRASNIRFTRRFKKLESLAQARNLALSGLDAETWQALWQQAKKAVAHLEK